MNSEYRWQNENHIRQQGRQALKIKFIIFEKDMKPNSNFISTFRSSTPHAADQTTINAKINFTKSSHHNSEPDKMN